MIKNFKAVPTFNSQFIWLFIALVPLYYAAYNERENVSNSLDSEFLNVAIEEEIVRDYLQQSPAPEVTLAQTSMNECEAPSLEKYSEKNSLSRPPAILNQVQQEITIFLNEKGGNKEGYLQDLVCNAYACLFLERTYQRTLGSHIKLLEYLEFHLGRFISEDEAYTVFQKNISLPQGNRAVFSKWLKFLERSHLIHVREGKIGLTDGGFEFLGYIRKRGYSLSRPG